MDVLSRSGDLSSLVPLKAAELPRDENETPRPIVDADELTASIERLDVTVETSTEEIHGLDKDAFDLLRCMFLDIHEDILLVALSQSNDAEVRLPLVQIGLE